MAEKIGGQAVIEGVMMKSDSKYSVAVRRKNNRIISKSGQFQSITKKSKFLALPFVRGVFILFEILVLGMKVLSWSANQAAKEEGEELTLFSLILTVLFAVILGIGLFVALPLLLTQIISKSEGIVFNIVDGGFRIVIFVVYIFAISMLRDIRRVFQYHGAEHKAVHCYEQKQKLTVENVRKFSTLHARCGTAFIVIVLIISIVVFTFVSSQNIWAKLLVRIALLPVIAGASYEFLKLSDKYQANWFVKLLALPGLAVQKITTREPDEKQIEVAIHALKDVLR
jgi:uncharacterized protein YqhQ